MVLFIYWCSDELQSLMNDWLICSCVNIELWSFWFDTFNNYKVFKDTLISWTSLTSRIKIHLSDFIFNTWVVKVEIRSDGSKVVLDVWIFCCVGVRTSELQIYSESVQSLLLLQTEMVGWLRAAAGPPYLRTHFLFVCVYNWLWWTGSESTVDPK